METSFNYCERSKAFFSSDESKYIKLIYTLQRDHPEDVQILAHPDTNDGCIYCTLPVQWFKLKPPRKSSMTEEQRVALRKRMAQLRNTNKKKGS